MDAVEGVAIVLQVLPNIFTTLADALTGVAEPGSRFLDDVVGHCQIEHIALTRDALAVEDVEFCLAKWRGNLVLHDLHFGSGADHGVAVFDSRDAADIDTYGGVELQRTSAGGGLRIAEHHADLLADLIDEDQAGARLRNCAGQL